MQAPSTIIKQNNEAVLRHARQTFAGKRVRAENNEGKIVEGTVSHVRIAGRRIEYFLAGMNGPHVAPTLVKDTAAA